MEGEIRYPAVSGQFYPDDKDQLRSLIDRYLNQVLPDVLNGNLKALIEPHAAYLYSGLVAAHGYRLLKDLNKNQTWKIFLIGPSHQLYFEGASTIRVNYWETPLGRVKQSTLVEDILKNNPQLIKEVRQAHIREHCLEVQLPFLQLVLKTFEIVPLVVGESNPRTLAEVLSAYTESTTLFIASSDLSHYYSYEEANKLDALANDNIPSLKINKVEEEVEACGKTSILTLLHLAKEYGWQGKLLDYRNSGDTAGDRSQVVGYGCYAFYS